MEKYDEEARPFPQPGTRLNWHEFIKVSYPPNLQSEEARYSLAWRINRWIGIRTAYPLYRMGLSANTVSAVRLAIAAVGIGMLGMIGAGSVVLPAAGVFLLAWQVNLDFAVGIIARANGTTGPIGLEMDGAPNAFARGAILILLGFLTGSLGWLVGSALASYMLVMLVHGLAGSTTSETPCKLPLPLRLPSTVVAMAVVLPATLAVLGLLGVGVGLFARAMIAMYLTIAVFSSLTLLRTSRSNAGASQ